MERCLLGSPAELGQGKAGLGREAARGRFHAPQNDRYLLPPCLHNERTAADGAGPAAREGKGGYVGTRP